MNGWFNTQLINTDKIKRVIAEFKPERIHIFSFAIWNQQERERFNLGTRPMIEQHFGIKLQLVLSVDDDIIPICCRQFGLSTGLVDFQEMSNFWGKQGAFRLCMRHHAESHQRHHPGRPLHALLLDDVVYDEVLQWPDLLATIEQRNIDQLYEPH